MCALSGQSADSRRVRLRTVGGSSSVSSLLQRLRLLASPRYGARNCQLFGCSVGAYLDKGSDNFYHPEKVKLRLIFLPARPLLIYCYPTEEAGRNQTANKAQRKKPLHRHKIISQKESAMSRARQGGLLKLLGGSPLFAVLASPKLGEKRCQR